VTGLATVAVGRDDFGQIERAALAKMRCFVDLVEKLVGDSNQRADLNSQCALFLGFADCCLFGRLAGVLAATGQKATLRRCDDRDFAGRATNDSITAWPQYVICTA